MSTEITAAGATPVAAPTTVQTPAAPAVVVPPPAVVATPAAVIAPALVATDADQEPKWLPARLASERKSQLKALGFADEAEAKAAAEVVKAAAESKKTLEQKALEAGQRADAEKARADAALVTVNEVAARMMIGLTDEQKKDVIDIAGTDPSKQVGAIQVLARTWASAAKTAQEAAAATATANAAATAAAAAATVTTNTAPTAGAPNGNNPPPANARAAYEQVRATNPFAAAVLGQRNPGVYEPKGTA